MARLYANENFPLQVVEALRRLGHDLLTVRQAGLDNRRVEDADVLAFAVAQGRALITINRRDFIRLRRWLPAHRGIVVCTEDADTAHCTTVMWLALCGGSGSFALYAGELLFVVGGPRTKLALERSEGNK